MTKIIKMTKQFNINKDKFYGSHDIELIVGLVIILL